MTGAVLAIRGSAPLQLLLGLVLVGAVALLAEDRLRDGFDRIAADRLPATSRIRQKALDHPPGTMSEDELAARLRRTHPDWEEERIRRVIRAFTGHGDPRAYGDGTRGLSPCDGQAALDRARQLCGIEVGESDSTVLADD